MTPERRREITHALSARSHLIGHDLIDCDRMLLVCIPELLAEIDALSKPLVEVLGPTIKRLTSIGSNNYLELDKLRAELTRLRNLTQK